MTPIRTIWRDLPIGTKGLVVIAIPLLPLIVTAIVYLQFDRALLAGQAETDRAWRNRELALQLYPLATEAESAVRGYLLGRDQSQLARKGRAADAVMAVLNQLEAGADDGDLRARLPRLRALVADRFSELDTVLTVRARYGPNSPEVQPPVQRGAALMGQLRDQAAAIVQRNGDILAARQTRDQRLRRQTTLVVFVGAAAGILGGIIGAIIFTHSISRRLSFATRNVLRLANNEPLEAAVPAHDEIGVLKAATARAGELVRRHEAELRKRMQELEALSHELEAFSYSVSHDLRAPLRHVAGFASMLQKSAGEALTDQQRRHIQVIMDSAGRMGRLIDDLLSFSRTSRAELRHEAVDVTAIVKDVQHQLAPETTGRHVRWQLHPLPRINGDPAMLRVMFDNLLSNAVKYTRGRETADIEIGVQPSPNGEAVLFVRDNGVGFDMQYQHKLFGVFQRLHSSDEFEGTGIGLATVRRIVIRHGGRTWAEGRPGEGATFYVALPTMESPA